MWQIFILATCLIKRDSKSKVLRPNCHHDPFSLFFRPTARFIISVASLIQHNLIGQPSVTGRFLPDPTASLSRLEQSLLVIRPGMNLAHRDVVLKLGVIAQRHNVAIHPFFISVLDLSRVDLADVRNHRMFFTE